MYHVVRKGRVLRKKFDSYEAARSWVRKRIRAKKESAALHDWSKALYDNPSISLYNYTIFKFN